MNAQNFKYPIPFVKMSGTGNDFIIIDHRTSFIAPDYQAEFTRLVCRRKYSVGADGLILIEKSDTADFRWQFYNGDGSRAEMCGNGARCAARFAFEKGIAPKSMRFETTAGTIEGFYPGRGRFCRQNTSDSTGRPAVEYDITRGEYGSGPAFY